MRRSFSLRGLTPAVALATALLTAPRAEAHALGAEVKLSDGKVALEAYYYDDTPARDAKVRVEDGQKQLVVEGRTDAKGHWSFARPQPGRYLIVVDAGDGHRTQLKVTIPGRTSSAPLPGASSGAECPCCDEPPAVSSAPAPPVKVSEGPTREEFTGFQALKLGIGLGAIAGLALAFWAARRLRHSSYAAGASGPGAAVGESAPGQAG